MNNPIMKFFTVGHLPIPLQDVSARVCDLASWMDENIPETSEKSMGLRFMLMAKDCFVRAQSELLDDAFDSENQRFRAGEDRIKERRVEPSQTATALNREPPPRQSNPDQAKAAAVASSKASVPPRV